MTDDAVSPLPLRKKWGFPLPRVHTGVPLGNGRLGVLIWGDARVLRLTLGCADFWDHRDGGEWSERMTCAALRDGLARGDEAGIREVFEARIVRDGLARAPSVLPVGRFEWHWPEGWTATSVELLYAQGRAQVRVVGPGKAVRLVEIEILDTENLVLIEGWPAGAPEPVVEAVPAWRQVGGHLARIGFDPPREIADGHDLGWAQACPRDPALAALWRLRAGGFALALARGPEADAARGAASRLLDQAADSSWREARRRDARRYWRDYWRRTPGVKLPNRSLAGLLRHGLYKLGAITRPGAVAATLQGPWIEDHQMPPWSSDYHFNVNVQMAYSPAWPANQAEHARPLLDLVWSWRERLRENARRFLGIGDGLLLPHATDDRGAMIGGFWTGTVDLACTAWMASLFFDYWDRGGGDLAFLRERARPMLRGALRCYEAMLEERDGRWTLPLSVSPEFGGNALDAWGRDASFQLAGLHGGVDPLDAADAALDEAADERRAALRARLPRATTGDPQGNGRTRILLWEGQDLTCSHRHHSHWGALVPFDVIEPTDPAWRGVLDHTYNHWNAMGAGFWSGWCVPWAAMLHTRIGSPHAAEALLEYWERMYCNEGGGTLHDGNYPKRNVTTPPPRPPEVPYRHEEWGEVMQAEAGLGVAAAILDMLCHTRRGVHWLFEGVPPHWPRAEFSGIRTSGGFLVSASWAGGRLETLSVVAGRAGVFRWRDRGGAAAADEALGTGQVREVALRAGERWSWRV